MIRAHGGGFSFLLPERDRALTEGDIDLDRLARGDAGDKAAGGLRSPLRFIPERTFHFCSSNPDARVAGLLRLLLAFDCSSALPWLSGAAGELSSGLATYQNCADEHARACL